MDDDVISHLSLIEAVLFPGDGRMSLDVGVRGHVVHLLGKLGGDGSFGRLHRSIGVPLDSSVHPALCEQL